MKRLIEKAPPATSTRGGIALALGMGLTLLLLWTLGQATPPAVHATAFALDIVSGFNGFSEAQRPLLQAPVCRQDRGDVLTVCPAMAGICPYTNVQAAVDAAHDGDVIKVATGTYTGVQRRPAPPGYAGSSVITQVVYLSKTVTIRGGYTVTNWATPDPEANPTTLDAQGEGRVIFITGNPAAGSGQAINPTIEGLRITGGDADRLGGHIVYESTFDGGGGVYVITATAIISGNDVFGNTAGAGGGSYLYSSDSLLHGNTVTSNTAGDGGGLYLCDSAATLGGNDVITNTATAHGGGLYLENSPATLSGNTFAANVGYYSGGLHLIGSDATLNGNVIISNTGSAGGGLYVEKSSVTFNSNTIAANDGSRGGGLYVAFSDVTLTNDVIADNQASLEGSGAYVFASSTRLLHATIARNNSGNGSGIHVSGSPYHDTFSDVALTNTILVSHTVGITVAAGNTTTLEATLWGTGTWANATDWSGDGLVFTGTTHIRGDPAFVAPDAGDYHIGLASAAIDRGVNAGVDDDVDGDPRPLGDGYDIGADETGLIVTKQAAPDPVRLGAQLTYTIRVTNTSNVTLTAIITDTLPPSVILDETSGGTLTLPGGTPGATWTMGITWTATITPGDSWTEQVVVTVEADHTGPLVNLVEVTTDEGATGAASYASMIPAAYLPLVTRRTLATVVGEYVFVGNPCTTDPCLPGMVYAVSADATRYYLTVAGSWLWENRSWSGYTPTVGDFITVTGYVNEMIDIFGDPFYNIEVASLQPATRPPYTCPMTSTNPYSEGIVYQYDQDDPVRPAYNHADKNLELRGYASNTDPGLKRELVDYGSDDPTQPPQLATLFAPYRVPTLSNFYRVHDWSWSPSPEPGTRGDPITTWPVTALGMQTTPGEVLYVPTSGYDIGGGMEVILLFADEDTIALKYAREDSAGAPGYTVHVDNICTDPNLLALYNQLDDPDGPRYVFPNASYDLPNLYDGQPLGTARDTEIVVAIVDTGEFMDTRSCNEWWQIRPGYTGACPPP